MAAISLRKIVKRYGTGPTANQVIHGVDAEIADGEFVVIVGPSGCGKSTLLRMVAGLEEISGGEIAIGGRVVNDARAVRARHRHGVPELRALSAHDGLRQHGVRPEDRQGAGGRDPGAGRQGGQDPRARPVPGPRGRASSPAASGSGWRWAAPSSASRRCSCSTSRCPTSTPSCAPRPGSRSRSCTRELRTTSLFVTHDQVEAMTLAERMIVMNAGRMEQIGTPDEVYHRPATTFVAAFIGSPPMNLVRGIADGAGFTAGGQLLPLPRPRRASGELVLGVRPEHVELELRPEGVGLAGAGAGARDARRRAAGLRRASARRSSPPGSTRPRRIPRSATSSTSRSSPEHMHWFDAATTARVGA